MACKIKMNLPKQEDGLVGWGEMLRLGQRRPGPVGFG